MGKKDPRIDAYIAKAQPFAKPILKHLRAVVHEACPDVVETIKWSMPHFDYGGRILGGMSAFKAHAAFGFWHGPEVLGDKSRNAEAMGDLGRITSIDDLPSRARLIALIKASMKLTDQGKTRTTRTRATPKPPVKVPKALADALKREPKAKATFEGFSPSARREYVEWITEAKTDATREKRLAIAVEWMAEGKQRHWKYQR